MKDEPNISDVSEGGVSRLSAESAAAEAATQPLKKRKRWTFWRITAGYLSLAGGFSILFGFLTVLELRRSGVVRWSDPKVILFIAILGMWAPALVGGVALFRKKLWARTFAAIWLCLPLVCCILVSVAGSGSEAMLVAKRQLFLLGALHLIFLALLYVNEPEPWASAQPLDPS